MVVVTKTIGTIIAIAEEVKCKTGVLIMATVDKVILETRAVSDRNPVPVMEVPIITQAQIPEAVLEMKAQVGKVERAGQECREAIGAKVQKDMKDHRTE